MTKNTVGCFWIKSQTTKPWSDGRSDINPLGSVSKDWFLLVLWNIISHFQTFYLVGPQGANDVSEAQRTVLVHTVMSVDTSDMGVHHKLPAQKNPCGSSLHLSVLPHCPLLSHSLICKRRKTSLSMLHPASRKKNNRSYVSWVHLMFVHNMVHIPKMCVFFAGYISVFVCVCAH